MLPGEGIASAKRCRRVVTRTRPGGCSRASGAWWSSAAGSAQHALFTPWQRQGQALHMTPIVKTSAKSPERQNAAFSDARSSYIARRRAAWDALATKWAFPTDASATYHRRLADVYRWLVPSGSTVLEVGCGAGDL